MNTELRDKGLPEKKIPDPNEMDQPARKFPKQKTGLRSTSDLVSLLSRQISLQVYSQLYAQPTDKPTAKSLLYLGISLQVYSQELTKIKSL